PQFRPLVARIPDMALRTERKDAFLGPALLFIAPGAAKCRIEAVKVECLFQRLGLHNVSMYRGTGCDRADAARNALLVDIHDEVCAEPLDRAVTELDHFAEFPGGVDMHQGKWQRRRIERLDREM